MKRIGIITSGGDCGGLNAVIKGAARMARKNGISPFMIPHGYAGLYNLVDCDAIVELTEERIDDIDANLAGSEAGHSRVKIKAIKDEKKYERIKEGLKKFKIDALVISGGDDSGSVMVDLTKQGFKCVHAPKTMDLDLQTYSVGGDSTIGRIAQFVEDLKTTAITHRRVMVMEVFGRYAGHTAFRGGIASEADAILIPEVPVDFDVLYSHCKSRYWNRLLTSDVRGGAYMVVVADGLKGASSKEIVDESAPSDAFGHKRLAGASKYVVQELTKRFQADPETTELMKKTKMYIKDINDIPEIRAVNPGHLVRCGHSSPYDVNFGMEIGAAAVQLLLNDIFGVTVANVKGSTVQYMATADAIKQRYVDPDLIAFYENLGVCFGRNPVPIKMKFQKVEGAFERHL